MAGSPPARPAIGGLESDQSVSYSRAEKSGAETLKEGEAGYPELENAHLRPVGELLDHIHALDNQDSGIWAKHVLVFMVVLAGFLSFCFPT